MWMLATWFSLSPVRQVRNCGSGMDILSLPRTTPPLTSTKVMKEVRRARYGHRLSNSGSGSFNAAVARETAVLM